MSSFWENKYQSSERSIQFIQESHAEVLRGLHFEIESLQKQCSNYALKLSIHSGSTAQEKEEYDTKFKSFSSDYKKRDALIAEQKKLIEERNRSNKSLQDRIKTLEKKLDSSEGGQVKELKYQLDAQAAKIAQLTFQMANGGGGKNSHQNSHQNNSTNLHLSGLNSARRASLSSPKTYNVKTPSTATSSTTGRSAVGGNRQKIITKQSSVASSNSSSNSNSDKNLNSSNKTNSSRVSTAKNSMVHENNTEQPQLDTSRPVSQAMSDMTTPSNRDQQQFQKMSLPPVITKRSLAASLKSTEQVKDEQQKHSTQPFLQSNTATLHARQQQNQLSNQQSQQQQPNPNHPPQNQNQSNSNSSNKQNSNRSSNHSQKVEKGGATNVIQRRTLISLPPIKPFVEVVETKLAVESPHKMIHGSMVGHVTNHSNKHHHLTEQKK